MTLRELLVLQFCVACGVFVALTFARAHHWTLALPVLPLGFLAGAAMFFWFWECFSIGPFSKTSGKLLVLLKSLPVGILIAAVFYLAAIEAWIPTDVSDAQGHGPDRGTVEWGRAAEIAIKQNAIILGTICTLALMFLKLCGFGVVFGPQSSSPSLSSETKH